MRRKLLLSAAPFLVATLIGVGAATPASASPKQDAQNEVNSAVKVAQTMERDQTLKGLMGKAKGIFILTSFGRGGLIVGGRGGQGVLLLHEPGGSWGEPVFYNMGGVSIGAQAGGSGGQAAFLLMTDNAVNHFKSDNNFSLNAGAGLTIINYSGNGQGSWGKGDVVFWTNTGGAYAGATVSATDVVWDSDETRAYYGKPDLKEDAVFQGKVHSNQDNKLQAVLPT